MTLYDVAGGRERLLAMTRAFYAKALKDDLLGSMFSKAAGEHAEYLAGWLSASFGGPKDYLDDRGDLRFVVWKHAGLTITEVQRARWADLMMASADEAGMPEAFTTPYRRFVEQITRSVTQNSRVDLEVMRAELGIPPGGDLQPRSETDR